MEKSKRYITLRKRIGKFVLLFSLLGCAYLLIELIFRAFQKSLVGVLPGISTMSLIGWTSLWMFFIGGLSALAVGFINQVNWVRKNLNVFLQCVLGAITILLVEFISGVFFNIWPFQLQLWDYSNLPLNILGQVSLQFGVYWFVMCPFAFWFDDFLRYHFYYNGSIYHVGKVYLQLLNPFAKPQFQTLLNKTGG